MEKELLNSANYKKLASHTELLELFKTLKETTAEINSIITVVQTTCSHTWKNEKRFNSLYDVYDKKDGFMRPGGTELVSKTCTDCGLHLTRPDKQPWVICYDCWSPMKYSHQIPGEDRKTVYLCTNETCPHGTWHT